MQDRLRTAHKQQDNVTLLIKTAKCSERCKGLYVHLDDDQTELTLQQKQEALADARGCVSCL